MQFYKYYNFKKKIGRGGNPDMSRVAAWVKFHTARINAQLERVMSRKPVVST